MIKNRKFKGILIGSAILAGMIFISGVGVQSVSAETFNKGTTDAVVSGKYSFTPQFTSKSQLTTWGSYKDSWTRSNKTELGTVGGVLGDSSGYGSGSYAKTLTSNGVEKDAGTKSYNGSGGVTYTNVGRNPKTGKMLDLKITITGADDNNVFAYDYRKISFSEDEIGFAETGYSNVHLSYQLVDHGTDNAANLTGFTLNVGDVDRAQTVIIEGDSYKKLAKSQVSKNSLVQRKNYGSGVQFYTNEQGSKIATQDKTLTLSSDGSSMDFTYGKDYQYLVDHATIEINGETKTYADWMKYFGNYQAAYRMRKDSAAAEYMNLHGSSNTTTSPDGSALTKKIVSNGQSTTSWKSDNVNPYQDDIKYELTTDTNGSVASGISTGKMVLKDTVDSAISYQGKPKVTAYNPDGSNADVTNDFDYTMSSDNSSFTFTSKDSDYIEKHTGTYYVISYDGKLKSNTNVKLPSASSGYISLNNTATQSWNQGSASAKAMYSFKPTTSSVSKTANADNQTADSNNANIKLDASKKNTVKYTLSTKLGNTTSDNKTMAGFGISDKLPNIFNKVNTSDVSVSDNGSDVTSDFNISISGDSLTSQTLTATPKDATKYYGHSITIVVNSTKNAITETVPANTAIGKALDENMTSDNVKDMDEKGETDVAVKNTYDLNLTGDKTLTSNSVNLLYTKVREHFNPVMNGTNINIRKSNSDSDTVKSTSIDGYLNTVVPANAMKVTGATGWTPVKGSLSYPYAVKMDTANGRKYIDFEKNQLSITGNKLILQTADKNNNSKMTVTLTRKNMWSGYRIASDADLQNANIVLTLKDDKGNVLTTTTHKLGSLMDSATESVTNNSDGSITNTVKFTLDKDLDTAKANYQSTEESGASTKDKIKNIQVSADISYGKASNDGVSYPSDLSGYSQFKDVSSSMVRTEIQARNQSLNANDKTTDYEMSAPLPRSEAKWGNKLSEYDGQSLRVLSIWTNTNGTADGNVWYRVLTRDGQTFWIDRNATKSEGSDNIVTSAGSNVYGSRTVNGQNTDITWEHSAIDSVKNSDSQRAWTPTKQTVSYDDLKSIQTASDKQGVTKVGGQYTLSGVQATVSDLTKGSTSNKLESLTVNDDALDFSISAGYGYSNNVKLSYKGYDLGNFVDNLGVNSLTTSKDQSSDLVGNGSDVTKNVKISTSGDKTTLQNLYNIKDESKAGTQDTDLDVASKELTSTYSLKNTYLDNSGNSVYYTASSKTSNGGNKLYTSVNTKLDADGKYHTDTVSLADAKGANQFKVSYDKHVAVDAPLVLTAADKTHNADAELSFQPVFDGYKPSGFTSKQNDWLKK